MQILKSERDSFQFSFFQGEIYLTPVILGNSRCLKGIPENSRCQPNRITIAAITAFLDSRVRQLTWMKDFSQSHSGLYSFPFFIETFNYLCQLFNNQLCFHQHTSLSFLELYIWAILQGENPKKPGAPNNVRLYSIASTRYGDAFDGKTASLCVRRAVYYDPETGKEDPSKKGICSNFLCDSKAGDKIQITGENSSLAKRKANVT